MRRLKKELRLFYLKRFHYVPSDVFDNLHSVKRCRYLFLDVPTTTCMHESNVFNYPDTHLVGKTFGIHQNVWE